MNTADRPPAATPAPPPFLTRLQPVAFAVLVLVLVFVLYQVVAGVVTFLLFGGRLSSENVEMLRWITVAAQLLCILLPTLLLARLRFGPLFSGLRLRLPGLLELAATGVAVIALQQVLQGYMMLQESIPVPAPIEPFVKSLKDMFETTYRLLVTARSPAEFAGVVVAVALVPAVSEELLFRGLVQRSFEQEAGPLRGAVITGLVFGFYHLNPLSLVPLVVLGIFFGYLVVRTGTTVLAVAAHFLNNFVACAAHYLGVSDDFVALAPAGQPPTLLVWVNAILFGVVFIAALSYLSYLSRKRRVD